MSNTNSLNVAKLGKATPHQNPPSPSAENTTALWIPAVRSAILTANHPGTDAAPKMVVSPHGPHSHHQPHILVPFAKWNQMPVLGDLGTVFDMCCMHTDYDMAVYYWFMIIIWWFPSACGILKMWGKIKKENQHNIITKLHKWIWFTICNHIFMFRFWRNALESLELGCWFKC